MLAHCLHIGGFSGGQKGWILTFICFFILFYMLNNNSEYPAFLECLVVVLEVAPSGDSVVLLEDFTTHMGSNIETWGS